MGISSLESDLVVDRVIGANAARAHYGVSKERAAAAGLLVRELWLGRTARSKVVEAPRPTVIVSPREKRLLTARESTLRHLAGVTATRLHVGAPAAAWRNEGGAPLALLEPDGYWQRPDVYEGAVWAIEYDAGSYSSQQVRQKLLEFRRTHGYQVWGVASEKRVAIVERLRLETDSPGQVHYVPWL